MICGNIFMPHGKDLLDELKDYAFEIKFQEMMRKTLIMCWTLRTTDLQRWLHCINH